MIKKVTHPHLAERSAALRAQFAGQEGLPASRTRCARGGRRRSARRGQRARGDRRLPRSQRSGGHPPLHAPLHLELRHRLRHVSAGLLHHEVQPADQRAGGAHRRPRLGASVSAGIAGAGLHGSDGDAGSGAGRDHRHGRGHAAARRRRARRADRHPADPRAARKARQPAQEDPDSGFGARHQPGHRRHRRLRGREHQVQRDRRRRSRRAGTTRRPTTSPR